MGTPRPYNCFFLIDLGVKLNVRFFVVFLHITSFPSTFPLFFFNYLIFSCFLNTSRAYNLHILLVNYWAKVDEKNERFFVNLGCSESTLYMYLVNTY